MIGDMKAPKRTSILFDVPAAMSLINFGHSVGFGRTPFLVICAKISHMKATMYIMHFIHKPFSPWFFFHYLFGISFNQRSLCTTHRCYYCSMYKLFYFAISLLLWYLV